MTCIAGLVTDKGVAFMAGDSAASDDRVTVLMAEPKVRDFECVLVGYAGEIRAGRKMFAAIDALTDWSDIAGFVEQESLDKFYKGTSFMVIQSKVIYEIEAGTRIKYLRPYAAIGSGIEVALGALFTRHNGLDDVVNAIDAAATFTPNVRNPAIVVSCRSL